MANGNKDVKMSHGITKKKSKTRRKFADLVKNQTNEKEMKTETWHYQYNEYTEIVEGDVVRYKSEFWIVVSLPGGNDREEPFVDLYHTSKNTKIRVSTTDLKDSLYCSKYWQVCSCEFHRNYKQYYGQETDQLRNVKKDPWGNVKLPKGFVVKVHRLLMK